MQHLYQKLIESYQDLQLNRLNNKQSVKKFFFFFSIKLLLKIYFKGHRRSQSLPPKLGVKLFVPPQSKLPLVFINPNVSFFKFSYFLLSNSLHLRCILIDCNQAWVVILVFMNWWWKVEFVSLFLNSCCKTCFNIFFSFLI